MWIVCDLLTFWYICLVIRIIMSWIPFDRSRRGVVSTVTGLVFAITEPVLGPLRRALPMLRVGSMGLDLSPIIVMLGVFIIQGSILHC